MSRKMSRKFTVSPSHRTCVIQNPIADLGLYHFVAFRRYLPHDMGSWAAGPGPDAGVAQG
jgi:hypothetical protein